MSLNNTCSIIQQNLNRYVWPICLTFGIIGCFLNIILFSQKQFRTISCCIYFLSASIIMISALIIGFIPHVYIINRTNPTNRISIICKIRGYSGQSIGMIYRWLMTMACIDRYMISSRNIRLRSFANPYIAYRTVIIVIIIFILLPLHNLKFLDIKGELCMNSRFIFAFYHSLFTFIFGGFLPSSIMIIFVVLIRSNLLLKKERRIRNNSKKKEKKIVRLLDARDYQVLIMLFVQIIAFIILTIPWMIFLLYSTLTSYSLITKSTNRIIVERFIRYLTEIIVYLYPTLSFYMYTLTSQTFRNELIHLIYSLVFCKGRMSHKNGTLVIQEGIGLDDELDQPNKIPHLHPLKMKKSLNSFQKMNL